jgi:hypothetical protein
MPEDSRPKLTLEAIESAMAGWAAAEAAPLTIPPGCSVSIENMVLATQSSVSAPSAEPPVAGGTGAAPEVSGSSPTQSPPRRDGDGS